MPAREVAEALDVIGYFPEKLVALPKLPVPPYRHHRGNLIPFPRHAESLSTNQPLHDGHRKSIIRKMELYHVLNRGVDKRIIFTDSRDRARFIHDMFEFNDKKRAGNSYRLFPTMDIVSPSWVPREKKRDALVDIHGWCLMPNHYHLILSARIEKGISEFIRKLNIGYAKYFNERHTRSGTLFQGRTKKVLIEREAHFLHILHYVHLNPLDMLDGAREWRASTIASPKRALEYLHKYRWSSFLDYCGKRNFSSILTTDLFKDVYRNYEKAILEVLKDRQKPKMDIYAVHLE
jgi:putative transposase